MGARSQRRGDIQPERLRGLEIDHELVGDGLHEREVARLFALEDAGDVGTSLPISVRQNRSVTHQAANESEFAPFVDRR